jgi:hypothetical protein
MSLFLLLTALSLFRGGVIFYCQFEDRVFEK